MKLILFLVINSFGFLSAFELNCIFGDNIDGQYFCANLKLVLHHDGHISQVTGVKRWGTSLNDVKLLYMASDNTRFIPRNLLNHFPNLNKVHFNCRPKRNFINTDDKICLCGDALYKGTFNGWNKVHSLTLEGHSFKILRDNTFSGLENAVHLFLPDNAIETINKNAFKDLKKLLFLQLNGNKIKKIEVGTFDDLINLEVLGLYGNTIEILPNELLRNNKKLNKIGLLNNHLKVIDDRVINEVPRLDLMRVENNICVDEKILAGGGNSILVNFKNSIKNCTNENAQIYEMTFTNRKLQLELEYEKKKVETERKSCVAPHAREMVQHMKDLQSDIEELRVYKEKYFKLIEKTGVLARRFAPNGLEISNEKTKSSNNLLSVLKRNKTLMKINARLVNAIRSVVRFMEILRIVECELSG